VSEVNGEIVTLANAVASYAGKRGWLG